MPFDIPSNWAYFRIETLTIPVGTRINQIQSKDILPKGKWPVVSQGKKIIDGYVNDDEKVIFVDSKKPLIMFGDHTRNVKIINFSFVIGADGTKFFKSILINEQYLYLVIKCYAEKLKNRGYARHYSLLKNQFLPLPSLNEQQRIVNKIRLYEFLLQNYD